MARLTARVVAVLCCVTALRVCAQRSDTLPIDTDRPDFTDGTHSLAARRIQLELGYTYQRGRGANAGYQHSVPEALVRVGVTSWAELRIGDNFLSQRADGPGAAAVHGVDDLYLGTKMMLTEQHGLMPALSLEAKVNVPTGSDAISAHRVLPGGALLLGWETSGPWSAGVEFFATRAAEHGQGAASLSVQYQATPRVQLFGEGFTLVPIDAGSGATSARYANTGILVLLSSNVQIDARFGIGLNHDAERYFAGLGFAVRR